MRIIVERQPFCDAVTNLSHAVATKSTNPVLEGIYLKTEGDKLKLTAYNYELGMIKYIDILRTEVDGEAVINARLLGEMLKRVRSETVRINVDEKGLTTFESNSTVYEIMGMAATDFPEMPKIDHEVKISIPAAQLSDMVRQTIFSVGGPDCIKPILTGEYFEIEDNELHLVAIDGYRMSVRREKLSGNENIEFVAAAKAIAEAIKLIGEDDKIIDMQVGRRFFSLTVNGYEIISRLMDGNYVDYRNLVAREDDFAAIIKLKTRDVIDIIDRISLMLNNQIVTPVIMRCTEDTVMFSCKTAIGKAADECRAEIEGNFSEIGFNSRYFYEAVKATETDEIIIKIKNSLSPILIEPVCGESFTYMVMPIHLKGDNKEDNKNDERD